MVRLIIAGLALTIWLSPECLAAQEDHAAEGEHGEEHGYHRNHIAIFLGATQAELEHGERDDPQFTIGIDYERRLSNVFGVGALLDVVVEGHREGIVAIPVFLHAGSFTFQAAAGAERIRDTGDWEPIGRLGLLYEFEAGKATISPGGFYDITEEGGTWVVGLTLGWGF